MKFAILFLIPSLLFLSGCFSKLEPVAETKNETHTEKLIQEETLPEGQCYSEKDCPANHYCSSSLFSGTIGNCVLPRN